MWANACFLYSLVVDHYSLVTLFSVLTAKNANNHLSHVAIQSFN